MTPTPLPPPIIFEDARALARDVVDELERRAEEVERPTRAGLVAMFVGMLLGYALVCLLFPSNPER